MTNTTQWPDPNTVNQHTGGSVQAVYQLDPNTGLAIGGAPDDVVATGTITGAAQTVQLQLGEGQSTWEMQFTGTFAGSTLVFEGSDDASAPTNWKAAVGQDTSLTSPSNITSITGNGTTPVVIRGTAAGYQFIRVRCFSFTGGDNIAVRMIGSTGASGGGSSGGGGGGGAITAAAGSYSAGALVDGADITQGLTTDTAVVGDNPGTLSAKLRGLNKIFNSIWDSVNNLFHINIKQIGGVTPQLDNTHELGVSLYGKHSAAGDTAVAVDASGNVGVNVQGTVPVSGTFWQATQPVSGTFWQATQPVSGTVTANAGTGNMGSNLTQVAGNAVAPGNNAVPILNSASPGFVAAYGSNAAALTANTDYVFKWGASGTTQVNKVKIFNGTTINILYEESDTATNAGSPYLAPGQTLYFDVQTAAVHIQGNGTPNVNGSSSGNVVIRGWL